MRNKFILFAIIPLLILFTIVYFYAESWVESSIEYTLEEIVGAKVEIDNLTISLSPLAVQWERMQVANPYNTWENIFEIGATKCIINENQLLRTKIIIENIELSGFVVNTKRATDGKIEASRAKNSIVANTERTFTNLAENTLKEALGSSPILDIALLKDGFNPDSLIKAFNFQTINNIDTLTLKIKDATNQWSSIKTDYENSKTKLSEIETKIKAINLNELNNAQNIVSAIATVDNSIKTINEIKTTITNRTSSVTGVVGSLLASVDSIDNFIKNDYEKLKNSARLPSINTPDMASFLVGNEMYERVKYYLAWVDLAHNNIKKYQPEPEIEKPERMKGQNIKFPGDRGYPDFWIKNVLLTVGNEKIKPNWISGKASVKNVTDNQDMTGLPLTIDLVGTVDKIRKININTKFDRRGTNLIDKYAVELSGVPLASFNLGKENFMPSKITNANLTSKMELALINSKFDSKVHFTISNMNLVLEREAKTVAEILISQILQKINQFNIELRLWNTKGHFDIALATDLDEKVSKGLKEVVGAEIAKLEAQLKAKFNSFINEQKAKFDNLYASKLNEINQNLTVLPGFIADKLNIVEDKKKELEEKLEKEKNSLIQNKLQDLFKKK